MSGFGQRLLRFARGSAISLPGVQTTPAAAVAATSPTLPRAATADHPDVDDSPVGGHLELRPEEFVVTRDEADELGVAEAAPATPMHRVDHGDLEPMPLLRLGALTASPGEVAVLHAEAGSGSEHMIAQVLGLTAVALDGIALWGHPVARLRPAVMRAMRQRIGVVPQRLQLLDRRSVFDNVALPLEIDGVPANELIERADAILQAFDLAKVAGRAVGTLSLAMQQRVAFARACIRRPELVLTDHPTMHQDEAGVAFFAQQLEAMRRLGATALVVTSDARLLRLAEDARWAQYVMQAGLPVAAQDVARDVEFVFEAADEACAPAAPLGAFAMANAASYAD